MSYISGRGGVTSRVMADQPVDQAQHGWPGRAREGIGGQRVVPDLYRRAINNLGALAFAILLYPAVWVYVRDMRRAGAR